MIVPVWVRVWSQIKVKQKRSFALQSLNEGVQPVPRSCTFQNVLRCSNVSANTITVGQKPKRTQLGIQAGTPFVLFVVSVINFRFYELKYVGVFVAGSW